MEQSLKVHLKHPQLYPAFAPATALSAGFDLRWPEREITLGVIDQDYTDPLIATLVNTGRREIVIRTGDRILQLLLVPILRPTVTLTSAINGSGRGGLGSTGVA